MASVFGAAVKRREDPRLITGNGRYTDDIQLPGMLYAAILRSPHAHARIRSIQVERAKQLPGVVAVFTGSDVAGKVAPIPTAWLPPNSGIKTPAHPPLAVDKVRYVGDGVAMVVAESRYIARDALDLIDVDYEILPAVVDPEKAMTDSAPLVHEDVPGNVAFHWEAGADPASAFEQAEVVIRHRFRQQRLVPNPMEPRAAVAQYNSGTGDMTV
ncbi:MAG: xanthine dehydrogenase family protein molybdopterin-binding subunit, partial [Alicyclobacillaceae bacterium]|nr:xanthine dehydrogenase family protein molybdopterin-binding subunit [Alicyclobacillaceae bacterium]